MKLTCPLLVVQNMQRSKLFYQTLLDQQVVMDFGENITFDGGFALQTQSSWETFLRCLPDDIQYGGKNAELYFETQDFDGFVDKLQAHPNVKWVHDVVEYPWGQRVVRFYDPDHHILEVGESMVTVAQKLLAQGMTPEMVAEVTQHPIEFVRQCMEE